MTHTEWLATGDWQRQREEIPTTQQTANHHGALRPLHESGFEEDGLHLYSSWFRTMGYRKNPLSDWEVREQVVVDTSGYV